KQWDWIARPLRQQNLIPGGLTVYTDAGRKSRRAAIVWKKDQEWHQKILSANPTDSLQTLELAAVVWALQIFQEPVNVVTDSLYVAGVAQRIEDATIREVQNRQLYNLL
ncbi:POK11 protein, partial [Eubucco bourcierii]|nr:POK11 protein [Eubucco bourcierii]